MADIEDRSCLENIKGIPESVQALELSSYVRSLIKAVLPDLKDIEMVIDQIHRLPKPLFLPETTHKDVILHFCFVKEQLKKQDPW